MRRLIICIMLGSLFGCKGFLDEVDQDLTRPETVDHYASLILNECTLGAPYFQGIYHMTDDISEDKLATTSKKLFYQTIYCWRREIEINGYGQRMNNNISWGMYYRSIAILNDVLLEIDNAEGIAEEVASVKGEAYFLRAFAYFNLVNLYAENWQPEKAVNQLGVPIRLTHGVQHTYSRENLKVCYEQIEADLVAARAEFEKSDLQKSLWHPSAIACDLLMSRICLYKQEWERVIEYTDAVIAKVPLFKLSDKDPFITASNPEIIYSFMYNGYNLKINFVEKSGYAISQDLLSCYDEENDIRRVAFFEEKGNSRQVLFYCKKAEPSYTQLGAFNMRGAEAYLNRAEAYLMLNKVTEAQHDLKKLAEKRYRDPAKVVLPDEPAALLKFIQDERRREFCWEEHHRWFDLRRMSDRPEIRHIFTYVNENEVEEGQEAYRLLKEDPNYVLPIPLAERENNPMIPNNDRLEKLPEKVN